MTVLLAFAMQTMCLAPLGASDVPLYYKDPPKGEGNSEPSRIPAKPLPMEVSLDEESRLLTFFDLSNNVYTYSVYDEDENIVSEGILDFSAVDTLYLDLSFSECGTYTLNVVYNGKNYVGTFDLP